MKSKVKFLKFLLPLVVILVAALVAMAQSPNGVRGAFTGNIQLPSGYTFTFGTGTATTDVSLTKNGSNVLGVNGNIGGAGAVANTTTTPAGPFAWGTVALSGGTATVTFKLPFAVKPVCVGNDQTATNAVGMVPNANGLTLVINGTTTDTIEYMCKGNPN